MELSLKRSTRPPPSWSPEPAQAPRELTVHHERREGGLAVDEIRRATVQEAGAGHFGPGDHPRQRLPPQEGPHGRAVDEEVLDALRLVLVAIAFAQDASQGQADRHRADRLAVGNQ